MQRQEKLDACLLANPLPPAVVLAEIPQLRTHVKRQMKPQQDSPGVAAMAALDGYSISLSPVPFFSFLGTSTAKCQRTPHACLNLLLHKATGRHRRPAGKAPGFGGPT